MRRLLGLVIACSMMTSQASTTLTPVSGNEQYGKHMPTVALPRTATQSVPAHVKSSRVPKFKVLRSNPHRYAKIIIDDLEYEIDDEGLISSYRRRDLDKIQHPDDINENVRWRLFLARQLAMIKYREKWA